MELVFRLIGYSLKNSPAQIQSRTRFLLESEDLQLLSYPFVSQLFTCDRLMSPTTFLLGSSCAPRYFYPTEWCCVDNN